MRKSRALLSVAAVALAACDRSPTSPTTSGADPDASGLPSLATSPGGVASGRIEGVTGRPFGVAITSAGTAVVTRQDVDSLTAYSLATLTRTGSTLVGRDPGDAAIFASNAGAFVTNVLGFSVSRVEIAANTTHGALPVTGNPFRVKVDDAAQNGFVTTSAGTVIQFNTLALTLTHTVTVGGAVNGLDIGTRAENALFVSNTGGGVFSINRSSFTVTRSTNVGGVPQEVVRNRSNSDLYVVNEAGWVDVLDANTFASLGRVSLPAGGFGGALSPDFKKLYVTSSSAGQLYIIDVATRTIQSTLTLGGTPRRVAFNANGDVALVANEGNWVDVIR